VASVIALRENTSGVLSGGGGGVHHSGGVFLYG